MIPSPHKLAVKRYAPGATDEFGNEIDTYGAPQDWWVRSVDPVSAREPNLGNRDLSLMAFTIQADKTASVPGYRDIVVVDGDDYPVDGRPDDWTRGPWANPVAGVTVWLRRAEG